MGRHLRGAADDKLCQSRPASSQLIASRRLNADPGRKGRLARDFSPSSGSEAYILRDPDAKGWFVVREDACWQSLLERLVGATLLSPLFLLDLTLIPCPCGAN